MTGGGLAWMGVALATLLLHGTCVAQDVDPGDGQEGLLQSCPIAGEQTFTNREHGVFARFPADSRVCETPMGSDEFHGFAARLHASTGRGAGPMGSGPVIDIRVRYDERPSRQELFDDACLSGGDGTRSEDGQPLAFRGLASHACIIERDEIGGRPIIVVAGTATLTGGRAEEHGRFAIYTATLVSSPETFREDKAMFHQFLDQLVLTPEPEEVVHQCFWTRATLHAANGTPSLRLRIQETGRVLGVTSPNGPEAPDELPANARTSIQSRGDVFGTEVAGEWRVCPLRDDIPGAMRPVRVTEARNLSVSTR